MKDKERLTPIKNIGCLLAEAVEVMEEQLLGLCGLKFLLLSLAESRVCENERTVFLLIYFQPLEDLINRAGH